MITEDYVSYKVAKLLKEKGFVTPCDWLYCSDGTFGHRNSLLDKEMIPAPTQQMAMKWLREKHDLHIIVYPYKACTCRKSGTYRTYCCQVYKSLNRLGCEKYTNEISYSYEDAVEAALKYSLENLI